MSPADSPRSFNFTYDVIDRHASQTPMKPALICLQDDTGLAETMTFSALSAASLSVAVALRPHLQKGDRVIIMLPRVPTWWVILLALMRIGAIPCPAATSLTPRDIQYRVEKSSAVMVIASVATVAGVTAAQPALAPDVKLLMVPHSASQLLSSTLPSSSSSSSSSLLPKGWLDLLALMPGSPPPPSSLPRPATTVDDPLLVYFTSGTTGYPKMVAHRGSYALGHETTVRQWHGVGADDIHFTITDTGWAKAAWGALFGQFVVGCTTFVWDYARFSAPRTLEVISAFKLTSFCAPPTAYRMLVKEDLSKHRFPFLRTCTSAGEPLNPEVSFAWKKAVGLDVREGYGQTETVLVLATLVGEQVRYGSIGRPLKGFHLATVDDQLQPCKPGEEGNLAISTKGGIPAGIFEGYVKGFGSGGRILLDDEANKKVFRDGWYLTGDRAFQDAEGYYWFVGRNDDVIKTSGYRVGPFEVESALIEHPAVMEAAVVGVPDKSKGQVIKACVILAPGYQASEELAERLREHTRRVTAPYKVPRIIEFVAELPKTVSGKIRRVELRQQQQSKL